MIPRQACIACHAFPNCPSDSNTWHSWFVFEKWERVLVFEKVAGFLRRHNKGQDGAKKKSKVKIE